MRLSFPPIILLSLLALLLVPLGLVSAATDINFIKRIVLEDYRPTISMKCNTDQDCESIRGGWGLCCDLGAKEVFESKICWFKYLGPKESAIQKLKDKLIDEVEPAKMIELIFKILGQAIGGRNVSSNTASTSSISPPDSEDEGLVSINSSRSGERRTTRPIRRQLPRIWVPVPDCNYVASINGITDCYEDGENQPGVYMYLTGRSCTIDLDCQQNGIFGRCHTILEGNNRQVRKCFVAANQWTYFPQPYVDMSPVDLPSDIQRALAETAARLRTPRGPSDPRAGTNSVPEDGDSDVADINALRASSSNRISRSVRTLTRMPKFVRVCKDENGMIASTDSICYEDDEIGRDPDGWLRVTTEFCEKPAECYNPTNGGQGTCLKVNDKHKKGRCAYSVSRWSDPNVRQSLINDLRRQMLHSPVDEGRFWLSNGTGGNTVAVLQHLY